MEWIDGVDGGGRVKRERGGDCWDWEEVGLVVGGCCDS